MPADGDLRGADDGGIRGGVQAKSEVAVVRSLDSAVRLPRVTRIQAKAESATIGVEGGALDADTDSKIRRATGSGKPLEEGVRRSMEGGFGADFSAVRVHNNAGADDLNQRIQAKAFTTGSDIFFRQGEYKPTSPAGQELLAHELTHVVQQGATTRRSSDLEPIQRTRASRAGARRRRRRAQERVPPLTVPSADSAFTKLATFVDVAVPTKGDSGGLEATVKIPLAPPSTFLEFDLAGELERTEDGVEGGFEVAIGYGGAIEPFGLTPEIVGKLGGFVEAQAGNASEMLKLISYGFFRQFRESNLVPKELTNCLWGQGGATGVSAAEEANKWGAELEEQIFKENANAAVGVGLYASVGASLGEEDAFNGELSTKVSSATKYNKESLEASGSGGASQLGKKDKDKESGLLGVPGYFGRGAEKSVGEVERKLETELKLSDGSLEGAATFEIAVQKPLDFKLEVTAKGELPAPERKPVPIAVRIVALLANLRGIVSFLHANESTIGQSAAELVETVDTIASMVASFATQKDELVEQLNGKIGGKGVRSLELGWSLEYSDGEFKPHEFSLSYVTEYQAEGPGVEAKIERKRKFFSSEWPKLPTP